MSALPEGQYALVNFFGHKCMVGRISGVAPYGLPMIQVEAVFRDQLLPPVLHTSRTLYRVVPLTADQALDMQAATLDHIPHELRLLMPSELYDAALAEREEVRARAAAPVPESVAHAMTSEEEPF